MTVDDDYAELQAYSLTHGDPAFIHQNVVDAHTAQIATACTKPIAVTFALVGLYLTIERNYTGRDVQLAHMRMARRRRQLRHLSGVETDATSPRALF